MKLNLLNIILVILVSSFAACSSKSSGEDFTRSTEAKSRLDVVAEQKEIIKRQEMEIERQKREIEDLKRQKYHNDNTARFSDE